MFLKEYKIDYSTNEVVISIEIPEVIKEDTNVLKDVYIDEVALQSYKYYTLDYPENPNLIIYYRGIDNKKEFNVRISLSDLYNISGVNPFEPLYLYIKTKGDSGFLITDLSVYCNIDWNVFYSHSIKLYYNLKDINDTNAREEILDIYFKKSLLQSAIDYKEFQTANKIWDDIMRNEILRNLCLGKCNNIKRI